MHIRLVAVRGFCAGVVRAIKTVEHLLDRFGPPIYVKHKIVHNRYVLEQLSKRGARFVDSLDLVPKGAICVFSAHGVPPTEREKAQKKQLRIVDATCGLVTKVHSMVTRYKKNGIPTVIIGHKNHVEVIGIQGESLNTTFVVENVQDVEKLTLDLNNPVGVVTQTTLSLYEVEPILKALEKRYPKLQKMPSSTICYATTNRQNALKNSLEGADLVLVVGDKESSNANRLVEVAQNNRIKSLLIEGPEQIDPKLFTHINTLVMTSGASVPEELFFDIVETVQKTTLAHVSIFGEAEEAVVFDLPKINF